VVNPLKGRTIAGTQPSGQVGSFYLVSTDPNSIDEPLLLFSRSSPSPEPDESNFEIGGVLPGSYDLYPLFESEAGYVTSRTPVLVGDHDVEGLRIVLKPNPDIRGRVVINGDASAIQWGDFILGVRSSERRLPVLLMSDLRVSARIADPRTGEFTLSGLIEDVRYGVRVNGIPPDAYIADIRQGGRDVYNDGVRSSPSDGDVEITIGLQGGMVQGVVRDALSQTVSQAAVVLVPSAPRRANSGLYKRAVTDALGQFAFRGVAPGDYKIFAWPVLPPPGQAEENEQFLAPLESRGVFVRVTAGATTTAQVPLIQ
jgi:hypothetical protein